MNGNEVTLVAKSNERLREAAEEGVHQFYGVEPVFEIEKIARPSYKGGGILYMINMWRSVWAKRKTVNVVFSRDVPGSWLASKMGLPVIYEAHGVPSNNLLLWLYSQIIKARSFCRLIVISKGLKDDLAAKDLLPSEDKVFVLHDGAKPTSFYNAPISTSLIRSEGQLNIGYVGQLYSGKGIEVILPLARRMPQARFHVVGGEEHDLARWRGEDVPENLEFYGFVAPSDLGGLYQQFDVLLLPAQQQVYGSSGQSELSRWMSPMKMFEYMLAGKPIISSDLPVLREVLEDGWNALLVSPDDLDAWQTAVERIQSDPKLAKDLGMNAKQDLIENYTWAARARKAIEGI